MADDGSGRTLPKNPGCPCFGDQPLLGADKYGIYITTNEFSILGPEFNGAQIYAIDKQALVAGTLKYQAIQGAPIPLAEGPAYSLQPAASPTTGSWNTANNGTEYLLSALDFNATTDNRIATWALTNTQSLDTKPAVTLTAPAILSSETYGQPPNAEQKKGPIPLGKSVGDPEALVATNDDRMNQVVYANGQLWSGVNTVIRTSNGASTQTDRSGIAYFIVTPSTPTATTVAGTITKQGYVALGNNDNVLYPSIGVNAAGKGVMTFSISGITTSRPPRTRRSTRRTVQGRSTWRLPAHCRPTTSRATRRSAATVWRGGVTTPPRSPATTARSGLPPNGSRARSVSSRSSPTGARSSATSLPSRSQVKRTR